MNINPQELRILRERVDTLVGVRGKPDQAAARVADLRPIREVVAQWRTASAERLPDLTSTQVDHAPTASDYNALQDDVAAIHKCLSALLSIAT